jgi:hypothetical protein
MPPDQPRIRQGRDQYHLENIGIDFIASDR